MPGISFYGASQKVCEEAAGKLWFAKSLPEVMISVWQSLGIRGWVCHLDAWTGRGWICGRQCLKNIWIPSL